MEEDKKFVIIAMIIVSLGYLCLFLVGILKLKGHLYIEQLIE